MMRSRLILGIDFVPNLFMVMTVKPGYLEQLAAQQRDHW